MPRPFYKYASPDTALAILRSKNVRYSSPLLFNDPFDCQSCLHFDFDLSNLSDKVSDRIHELAAALNDPSVDQENIFGKAVLAIRENYSQNGVPSKLSERFPDITLFFDLVAIGIESLKNNYQSLLSKLRVFCVSEEKENLLMWAHYAKDHTGCIFEFWSLPDEKNLLSRAQPVDYVSNQLPFFTEQELIDDIVAIKPLDFEALSRRYTYQKSSHWAYEREWRVCYDNSKSTILYDDLPIHPSELRALYIGCKASADFSEEAIGLLRKSYPKARVYRSTKKENIFALQYEEVYI